MREELNTRLEGKEIKQGNNFDVKAFQAVLVTVRPRKVEGKWRTNDGYKVEM